MRLLVLVSLAFVLSACDRSTEVSIEVRATGTPAVARYEVALLEGLSCPDVETFAASAVAPLLSVTFAPESPMSLGQRDESGPHALVVLGRALDCTPVSFGCTPLTLGDTDSVTVTLSTVESFSAPACGTRVCRQGACEGALDAGPGDAGALDGGLDAAPDAGPDAGTDCADRVCGDPAVARCVSGTCQLVESTPEVRESLAGAPIDYLNTVRLAHTGATPTVHIGTLEAAAGGAYRSVVTSLALASLSGAAVRTELPEDAAMTLAASMDVRGDGNTLHWSVAGRTEPTSTVAVWVGTLLAPGATASSLPLAGINPEVGLGPQLILGGNPAPIRYVSVTRDETLGLLQAGSVPPSPSPSDYLAWDLDPVPGGSAQTAAGDGRLVVMEFLGSRDLAVWRPYPDAPSQSIEARPEGARGPLALADLGAERYLLGYPVDDSVLLTASDCSSSCSFSSGGRRVTSAGALNAIALVGTPASSALLVEGLESATDSRVTVRPVDRDGVAGDAFVLWSRPSTERVIALAAEFITTATSYELLVAALVQSRADTTIGQVGLIRVSFPR